VTNNFRVPNTRVNIDTTSMSTPRDHEPRGIVYTNAVMDADEDYPVSVGPTVLPEIWAPGCTPRVCIRWRSGPAAGGVHSTGQHALDLDVRPADGATPEATRPPFSSPRRTDLGTSDYP
jgi:hypothetical protein